MNLELMTSSDISFLCFERGRLSVSIKGKTMTWDRREYTGMKNIAVAMVSAKTQVAYA